MVTVKDQVPAGIEDPITPAVLHPYPLNDVVLGVPMAVEPDVYASTMKIPVEPEPTAIVVLVFGVLPGDNVVKCL